MKINLIKASAGSGKTYTLMGLLSKSIAAGVKPEGLLATTFTVKAAAELKSRIRQELLSGSDPELASQVFDGLIGTVNGVCGELLSEYAIESGLSPALDVLPDDNADMIFASAAYPVFEEYADELEKVAARLELNPLKDNPFAETRDWRKDVRAIVNFARSNRIDQAGLLECAEKSCAALKEVFTAENDLSLKDVADMVYPYRNFDAEGGETVKTVNAINDYLRFPTWSGVVRLSNSKYTKNKDPEFPIGIFNSIGEILLSSKELYSDMCTMIRGVFSCAGKALAAYAGFKKDLGLVDFVDQESNVLTLLETNDNFRDLMRKRINQVMVDEFQDTSPIQLALFLKLHECSQNGSVWVGDPKQAIYAFRGTDPELMEAVASTVPDYRTLEFSWRSKENLVNLSNAIFKKAFSDMPEKDVVLGIHPDRKPDAAGGTIGAWHLTGSSVDKRMAALAGGIAGLIRDKGVAPGDICVLFRSNADCKKLSHALAKWNISASAPAGALLDAPECQLVMAAYRYCIDDSDSVALATLTALYGGDGSWLNKFSKAMQRYFQLSEEERKKQDPFAGIKDASWLKTFVKPADATPLEILEYVISELALDRKIGTMSNSDLRMSNLDELRKVCNEYMNQALVNRTAATPAGFVAMLNESGRGSAAGFGSNTVNVMTYHKSKGLEFPIVILGSLDSAGKSGAFGIHVQQSESFDVNDPLKDRSIHYWPWPFGSLKSVAPLADALADNPIRKHAERCEESEGKRVLYVGLTRAKDQLIFAVERKSPSKAELKSNPGAVDTLKMNWLSTLTDDVLFDFPMTPGEGVLTVGKERFAITTTILSEPEETIPLPSPVVYGDECIYTDFAPAKKNPSSESAVGKAELLTQWDCFTGKIQCGKGKFNLLGSAFHDFIAMNPEENGKDYAKRLLENYGVEESVAPEVLVECTQNLYRWISETYPLAKISCEVPMTYHDENGTLYQGFIDMLLELPEGFVIIDHKTHPSKVDAMEYAASCSGQLDLYRKAVEAATGKTVLQTIIHLPNSGRCYEVK